MAEIAADDIAALCEALAIPTAIVVGYSMGGPIAQLTARRHPERVCSSQDCTTRQPLRPNGTVDHHSALNGAVRKVI